MTARKKSPVPSALMSSVQNAFQNPILTLALSVLVSTAGGYLYISNTVPPREAQEAQQAGKIESLKSSLLESQNAVKALPALRRENQDLEPRVSALEARIPNEPRLADVVRDVRDSAAASGVLLGEGRPSFSPTASLPLKRLDLEIGATGDFVGLYHFMEILEQTQRLHYYTSPALKLGPDRSIETRITVKSYYMNTTLPTLPTDPGDPDPRVLEETP